MSKAPFLLIDDLKDNAVAIAISLALHLILAWFAFSSLSTPPANTAESVIEVSFVAPEKIQNSVAHQMVSPSQAKTDKPPAPTNRLSDEDSVVEKEQIRRGDPGSTSRVKGNANDQGLAPPQKNVAPEPKEHDQKQAPKSQHPSPQQKAAPHPVPRNEEVHTHTPPKLTNLKLDTATMMDKFGELQADEQKADLTSKITGGSSPQPLSSYKAFSRPSGSGAAFLGTGGVRDFLPGLPDGDITLLNAKASTYASFVRRVATQVFALMRQSGWDQLVYGDIRSINGYNTVVAVLSPDGRFLRAELTDGSGSTKFDTILVDAAQRGARDPNPPKGAESADGTIRFIFKSRSWAEGRASAQNGAPVERRWLMLATGLE